MNDDKFIVIKTEKVVEIGVFDWNAPPPTGVVRIHINPPINCHADETMQNALTRHGYSTVAKRLKRKWYQHIWPWSKKWGFDYIAIGRDDYKEDGER
jgi:hypothetical protein